MTSEADAVCELVTAACELVERYGRADVADERAAAQVALLRDELRALTGLCADDGLADDLGGAASELNALLARLALLPQRVPALTG